MPRNVELIQKLFGSKEPLPSIELADNALKLGGVLANMYALKSDLNGEVDVMQGNIDDLIEALEEHKANDVRHLTQGQIDKINAAINSAQAMTIALQAINNEKAGIIAEAVQSATTQSENYTDSEVSALKNDLEEQINNILPPETDLSDFATKEELSGYATQEELNDKVDAQEGYSLVADSQIEKLETLENYDDAEIRTELGEKASTEDVEAALREAKDYADSVAGSGGGTGGTITLDDDVTQNSSNGVKSSGIYTAIQNSINTSSQNAQGIVNQKIQYSTTDLEAGVSTLNAGIVYLVYEE